MSDADPALDRSGHLPSWAFDRLRLDSPTSDPAFFAAAERHLAGCSRCRATGARLDAEVASLSLPPRAATRARAARPRTAWWLASAGVLAAAAIVLVVTRAPQDDVLAKGSRFDFEVHVDQGTGATQVHDGATIRPGARAGFRVRSAADGHLLVFGWDERGRPYPIHPAPPASGAAPILASAAVETLPAAIAFDAVGDAEHLAAIWCPASFDLADLDVASSVEPERLERAVGTRGCLVRLVHLVKAMRP